MGIFVEYQTCKQLRRPARPECLLHKLSSWEIKCHAWDKFGAGWELESESPRPLLQLFQHPCSVSVPQRAPMWYHCTQGDACGLFHSWVTRPYIFIKRFDCIIISIFIEKGKKLIPAKRGSTKGPMHPSFNVGFRSTEKHRKPLQIYHHKEFRLCQRSQQNGVPSCWVLWKSILVVCCGFPVRNTSKFRPPPAHPKKKNSRNSK